MEDRRTFPQCNRLLCINTWSNDSDASVAAIVSLVDCVWSKVSLRPCGDS